MRRRRWRQGPETEPQYADASAMLGMSYLQTGQIQKAEEPLETALRGEPEDGGGSPWASRFESATFRVRAECSFQGALASEFDRSCR